MVVKLIGSDCACYRKVVREWFRDFCHTNVVFE